MQQPTFSSGYWTYIGAGNWEFQMYPPVLLGCIYGSKFDNKATLTVEQAPVDKKEGLTLLGVVAVYDLLPERRGSSTQHEEVNV